jgi:serine/threonine protein kinase
MSDGKTQDDETAGPPHARAMNSETLCMGCMRDKGDAAVCPECGFQEGTPPDSPAQLPPRTILAEKYVLGRVLGQGGFGITYLAWDLLLNRKLAIKEYYPREICSRGRDELTVQPLSQRAQEDFQYGKSKFVEEGQNLARFRDYPGIVSLLEFIEANGTAYIVMAYMEGMTFKQYLEKHNGKIPFEAARAILDPVMDALREVHRIGMLHRDISPDNIYLNTDHQVKILDFGSTRYAMKEQSHGLTVIFKPGYAPLEQYTTHGKQGAWTDVYAVGATLYRALTGSPPVPAPDRLENDPLVSPSRQGVAIPPHSEAALLKALAVRVEDRLQTIEDFQNALSPEEIRPGPGPVPRGNPVFEIAAGVLLLTTLAFAGSWYSSWSQLKVARQQLDGADRPGESARLTAELAAVQAELEDTKQKLKAGSPELAAVTSELEETKKKLHDATVQANSSQTKVLSLTTSLTAAQRERDALRNQAAAARNQIESLQSQLNDRHVRVVYFDFFSWNRKTNARNGPAAVQFQGNKTEYILCVLGGPNPQQGSQPLSGAIEVRFITPHDLVKYTVTLPVTADKSAATWATQAIYGQDKAGLEHGNWRVEIWSEGQRIANKAFLVT